MTQNFCTKMYDKRDDFDFDIVNFPFLDGDASPGVPRMKCIYLNLFVLLEHLITLVTLIVVKKPLSLS